MTTHEDSPAPDAREITAEVLAALSSGAPLTSFSQRNRAFALTDAYQVAAAVRAARETQGERAVGRKIGFTNSGIWAEYGIYAPIWGYVYDRTAHDIASLKGAFSLAGLREPRIEPEIILGLAAAPTPDMDEHSLLECIAWIAHGFEIVHSPFEGWRFSAADGVAACGLHAALLIGPRHAPTATSAWRDALTSFEIDLMREGRAVDHGRARNVLGGPLSALRHLNDLLANDRDNPPLGAGEIVTTGTLTRALPIAPGETWSTALTGAALEGVRVAFR